MKVKNNMKVRYLGTAASEGFPAVFCNCEYCQTARKTGEFRTRSQVLIEDNLLIDFPPETYLHAVTGKIDLSAITCLLVTHSHTDHFYAQEFVNRGYKFAYGLSEKTLNIYGNKAVKEVYIEGTYREIKPEVAENIVFNQISPFYKFECSGYEIHALPACHGNKEDALVYFIKKGNKGILHLNDTGLLKEEVYSYLKDNSLQADLINFDCTLADRAEKHSGRHMNIYENLTVLENLKKCGAVKKNAKLVLTHLAHHTAPFQERMDALANKYGFIAAYDGMLLDI